MASTSSAIRPTAKRARTSSRAARAHPLAQRRVARERREPLGQRLRVADRLEVAALAVPDDGARAARPGRDDRPLGRERLDRDHGRALVRRGQQERVERRVPGPDALLEADEPAAVGDAELGGERLHRGAILAVADEHEQRVDARSTSARSVRMRSSGRLIAVRRPAQPTTNVVVAGADLRADARGAPRRPLRSTAAGRSRTGRRRSGAPARRRSRRGRPAPRR